jgi:hypothetical protein
VCWSGYRHLPNHYIPRHSDSILVGMCLWSFDLCGCTSCAS